MASVEAVDGRLEVSFPDGTAAFELGPAEAERWAERILHPPPAAADGLRPSHGTVGGRR
jgi:hypothetical protein